MAKIIFTYYPIKVLYNHGAALLSAICKDRGIESHVIPMGDGFKKAVADIGPDYVCMSFVTIHDYEEAIPYIEMIKKAGIPILAGGVYMRLADSVSEDFLHICRGDGELLPDFILNGDTKVFDEKHHCEDISILPDYSTVTGNEFDRGMDLFYGEKIIPYSSSRGCPFHCSFCVAQKQSKKIRVKNTIREDLKYLHDRFHPDLFYIMDELPPYYREDWREQMRGNEYRFLSYIRADIKEDELRFLIDNGLSVCSFGVEVGDEDYRNKVLKKGVTDADIWRTVEILKINNIPYLSFFMTGMEPEEIKIKTFDMAKQVGGESIIYEYEAIIKEALWDSQQQRH